LDIAEIRLDLIVFAVKAAYRHLSPPDFDLAYQLAEQISRSNSAKEQFESNHRFWDIIFEASRRPVRQEIFRQIDNRTTRYYPLTLRLFPDPKTRPRQREVLIEYYRKGKVDEALRAFKSSYFEVVHCIIDHLEAYRPQSELAGPTRAQFLRHNGAHPDSRAPSPNHPSLTYPQPALLNLIGV
jgi:DNA-binding GntR family transcriptional regulator